MQLSHLAQSDPEIFAAINDELGRQRASIELIASENFVSLAVMEAVGSVLTNKYAEGLPGKRYYGGCWAVDAIEELARERAKKLFGCAFANVQPHSGAQANYAAEFAFAKPGDVVMGMDLSNGGHLTHGSPANYSGKLFNMIAYGLDPESERIDYDDVAAKAEKYKPTLIIAGASAYPRIIDFERFAQIAHDNGAKLMVDMAHIAGLVATGAHPSPLPYADVVTTTTHKTCAARAAASSCGMTRRIPRRSTPPCSRAARVARLSMSSLARPLPLARRCSRRLPTTSTRCASTQRRWAAAWSPRACAW